MTLLNPLLKWALGGTVFVTLLLGLALVMERQQNDKLKTQLERSIQGRAADRAAYQKAQAEAKANNLQNVRKIEQQQKATTDAIQSRWDADRARLAELLRNYPSVKGHTGQPGSPVLPDTAGGPDGSRVCIPEGDALSAARNELRLFYLQEWIREQLKVGR